MRKKNVDLLLFIILFTFSSCYSIVFSSMGVLDKSASAKTMHNQSKEIIFIPMHHIGKKEFYDDVKNKIDSLRKAGFVLYYEGTKFSRVNDSLKNDTIAIKLRNLIGIDFRRMRSQGGYIDTLNNTLMGLKVKAVKRHKLVNQPKYSLFDTTKDRRVDVYLSDALAAFEDKYGEVKLTDCDFKTKPGEKYSCSKYNGKGKREFLVLDYRNNFIANEIMKDAHNKIVLVYGAKHFEGILNELQQKDSTWKSY